MTADVGVRGTDPVAVLAHRRRQRLIAEAIAARNEGRLDDARRILDDAASELRRATPERPVGRPGLRVAASPAPKPPGPAAKRRRAPDDGGFVEAGSDTAETLRVEGAARHVIRMIHDTVTHLPDEPAVPIVSNAPPRRCKACTGTDPACGRCAGTGVVPVGWEGPLGRMLRAEFRRDPELRVDEVVAAIIGECRRRRRPVRITSDKFDELIGAVRRGPFRRVRVFDLRRGVVLVEQGETKFRPHTDDEDDDA